MPEAVEVIERAAREKRSVMIHGDYDVDGIAGTALLFRYLSGAFEHVYRFVPDRRTDGYGMAARSVDWASANEVGLVIAVDCGTSDGDLIRRLQSRGTDVVVCDHHELPPDAEPAGVMLNPVRPGETYPFRSLCGTAVAYKLVEALEKSGVKGACSAESLLDLVALATVGDVMPLVDENRYHVQAGLSLINRSPRAGFEAIREYARLGGDRVKAGHISFIYAPRINAPGRVSRPKPALELLCTDDRAEAGRLAATLEYENARRKDLTQIVHEDASDRVRDMKERDAMGAFVLAAEHWDEGVLGIAAARVAEEWGKPAVLFSIKGALAKGSGRSVAGVNLKAHCDRLHEHFVRYGGHAQAVGLTLRADGVEAFGRALSEAVGAELGPVAARPRLEIDAAIELEECSLDLVSFCDRCEPFGWGNREPVWRVNGVKVAPDTGVVGNGHLKLHVRNERGHAGSAIAFNWDRPLSSGELVGRTIDIAVHLRRGRYMNREYAEMRLADLREHGSE